MRTSLVSSVMALFAALVLPLASKASSEWTKTSSTYEVPVPAHLAHLKDVAVFEIDDVRVRTRSGVTDIRYNLPLELTGTANRIRLQSFADGSVRGAKADGTCSTDACSLQYKDLSFNEAKVRDLFRQRGVHGLELEQRLQVFQLFNGNPAGIIRRN